MPVEIYYTRRFLKSFEGLNAIQQARVEGCTRLLRAQWGNPHHHGGLSIRRLHGAIVECRAGLDLRVLFLVNGGTLDLFFVGSHDSVQRLLRGI